MQSERPGTQFLFVGNHPCLDFINTEIVQGHRRVDLLDTFASLVAWLQEAGLIGAVEASRALDRWAETPEGADALERARSLRAVLREMVAGIVTGEPVGQTAVDEINRLLRQRATHTELARGRAGFERRVHAEMGEAIDLLGPVAESAADLLCDRDLSLVKACENPRCILYFYDTTKNHARRWCSMDLCGNRAKAAAHYRRRRSQQRPCEREETAGGEQIT